MAFGFVALVAATSLTGCTANGGEDSASSDSDASDVAIVTEVAENPWVQQYVNAGDEKVRWGDDLAPHIILTTYGSGSCPTVPASLDVVDESTLAVTLEPFPVRDCTTDLRPTAFAAERPAGLDLTKEITVLVEGDPYGTLGRLVN